jgi:hypothetical protein
MRDPPLGGYRERRLERAKLMGLMKPIQRAFLWLGEMNIIYFSEFLKILKNFEEFLNILPS